MADYHINIFYSEEDKGYIADIPDLKACSAFGRTAEAALAAVEEAKRAWLEAARAAHKPIPPPQYPPIIARSKLRKVTVEELKKEIERREKALADLIAKRDALNSRIAELESLGVVATPAANANRRSELLSTHAHSTYGRDAVGPRLAGAVREVGRPRHLRRRSERLAAR